MTPQEVTNLMKVCRAKPTQILSSAEPDDFLAWRQLFEEKAIDMEWDVNTVRKELRSAFTGMAFKIIQGVDLGSLAQQPQGDAAKASIKATLDLLQECFLPPSTGPAAILEFTSARQIPGETVMVYHSRLRGLFRLAFPDRKKSEDTDLHLVWNFINGLADPAVRTFVRDSNPDTFKKALSHALHKTASMAQDSKPTNQDNGYINYVQNPSNNQRSYNNPRPQACFYCHDPNHIKRFCPKFTQALNAAYANRRPPSNQNFNQQHRNNHHSYQQPQQHRNNYNNHNSRPTHYNSHNSRPNYYHNRPRVSHITDQPDTSYDQTFEQPAPVEPVYEATYDPVDIMEASHDFQDPVYDFGPIDSYPTDQNQGNY